MVLTDSVARCGAGEAASWSGYDLGSPISKGLIFAFGHRGTAGSWSKYGVGFHNSTLPTGVLSQAYYGEQFPGYSRVALYKEDSGNTILGSDTTIWSPNVETASIWGVALYIDGDSNVQKCFIQSGGANWIEVLSTSDAVITSFQSCFFITQGSYARMITPLEVWGA